MASDIRDIRVKLQRNLSPYKVVWRMTRREVAITCTVMASSPIEACRLSRAKLWAATGGKVERWKLLAVM